jgi:predicted dinucleotide-binding enzyme
VVRGWTNVTPGDREDVHGCDVVVLAFPWREAEPALADIDLADHVVVDATNAFSATDDVIDAGPRGSTGVIADLLPGARVVKAFNTVPDERLVEDSRELAATARRVGLPVAADDVDARDEVADLMGDIGFTAVPVGGLDAGRDLMEPASPLFNVPLPARELEERLRQLRG